MNFKDALQSDLDKQLIHPSTLLGNLRVIDENSRKVSAYVDPLYIPFFYHLGKYVSPVKMVEIGFGLGFCSTSFLRSCKTVERLLIFQEKTKEFYSSKFGEKNVKSVYRQKLQVVVDQPSNLETNLQGEKWELVLFNEEQDYDKSLFYLELAWKYMAFDGFLVVDHVESNDVVKKAFEVFCKMQNRIPTMLRTRYGVGIIQR